jgi:DNA polymerase III delta subunit
LIQQVNSRSRALGINIPTPVARYIADAVGNDLGRMQKELEKLVACRGDGTLTLSECQQLIPNLTQDAFELAETIKDGDTAYTYQLSRSLFDRHEISLRILAGVLYKFEIWLKFSAAVDAGINNEKELAIASGIANPKQCYFLRQQVARTNTLSLARALLTRKVTQRSLCHLSIYCIFLVLSVRLVQHVIMSVGRKISTTE